MVRLFSRIKISPVHQRELLPFLVVSRTERSLPDGSGGLYWTINPREVTQACVTLIVGLGLLFHFRVEGWSQMGLSLCCCLTDHLCDRQWTSIFHQLSIDYCWGLHTFAHHLSVIRSSGSNTCHWQGTKRACQIHWLHKNHDDDIICFLLSAMDERSKFYCTKETSFF